MQETIVEFLSDRGTLVQPEALDYLASLSDPVDRLKEGFRQGHEVPFVLTLDHARHLTEGGEGETPEPTRLPDAGPGDEPPPATARDAGGQASTKASAAAALAGEPAAASEPAPAADPDPEPATAPGEPSTGPPAGDEPDAGPAGDAEASAGNGAGDFEQETTRVADEVKVELDITGESTCEGTIEDFTKLFRDRYNRMRRMLRRQRREMVGAVSIADLEPGDDRKVIGLVKDVKTTKNGHRILELEDDTGETVVLAPKEEDRLLELSDTILMDEVVGIVGKKLPDRGNKDGLLVMEELVRVDLRLDRDRPEGEPGSAVFVSDVHLGADTFLADAWDGFVDWLADRAAAPGEQGVRYLVVAGDLVEGAGVYPGQEAILQIPDVYDQYARAAETLDRLPDDLRIVIQPGNHDSVVRLAEPQPGLPEEVRGLFGDNVRFVGNPCRIGFNDVTLLSYHGVSLFDYFEALPGCNIDRPVRTMEEILRRRHLCPPFGGSTPLAPEHRDHLVVDEEPDIFVTGHVHAARTGEYRGTRLINASTWQEQTDYQRMRGFDPDPCKAFEVDLSTLGLTTWAFDHDEGTGEVRVETTDVSRTKVGAMDG